MNLITKHSGTITGNFKFSIVIPSWNNLPYLKLCVESIEKNSKYVHQIIIHVNEGSDGTLDWVKSKGFDYTYSAQNAGICFPLNFARTLLRTDYFLYMNDDMYVCPNWDSALWEEIEKTTDTLFFFSSTMLEPFKTANKCVISPAEFGTSIETFKEDELLQNYNNFDKNDWSGATWPPNVLHKDLWDLVGGYSIEFSPGMYSDPDFSMKLWNAGVRNFKGISKSRVYHFGSKTTGKIVKNNGSKQFLLKWGMTSKTFTDFVLLRGENYTGTLQEPTSVGYVANLKKSKLKRIVSILKK